MAYSFVDTTEDSINVSALPFEEIKSAILGADYTLSFALINEEESRRANKEYRNKDNATDVLSFPLSDNEGEILICPAIAAQKAPEFGYELKPFIVYLFIHGCAHLKGFDHGDDMENFEAKYREMFSLRPTEN